MVKIQNNSELPTALPVFPLPGLILFPRCQLPLHIFETRYRALLSDILKSHRMLGLIQPSESGEVRHPSLFKTGTVGRIISHKETGDGRYYVVIEGVCRFDIVKELPLSEGGYREVLPDYDPYATDLVEQVVELSNRRELLDGLAQYSRVKQIRIGHESIDALADDELLAVFCSGLPFSSEDKQALLEAIEAGERARILWALLELESHDEPSGSGLPQ